jgi:hypothetical protein
MNKKKFKGINVSKSHALLEAMFKSSNYYITVVFDEMINANDHTKFRKMDWPILSIINSTFSANVYKSDCDVSITDIFKF